MDASGHADIPLNAIDRHVGARLRARRLFLQMSEEWLAGLLEVPVEDIAGFEAGTVRIGHEKLLQVADVLDVAERYFYQGFGGKAPEPKRKPSWLRDVDHWFASQLFPHESALLAVARKMTGNTETARDLVQETYADVLSGDKWRGIVNPRAYAMKAVRSFAGRLLQRARIVPIELLANMESISQADLSPDAYDILSAKEKRRLILEAIEDLPPQCRKVVKLRRLGERLPKDIAKELGISLSMVEKHLARGMSLIADRLAEYEPRQLPGQPSVDKDVATGE